MAVALKLTGENSQEVSEGDTIAVTTGMAGAKTLSVREPTAVSVSRQAALLAIPTLTTSPFAGINV
jgi:hypothetical protein